jgi:hypothetical protein
MNVLRVTTPLPHISPGNEAWRKQMSATNTQIHKFTGDNTGHRQNIFTSLTQQFWKTISSELPIGPK